MPNPQVSSSLTSESNLDQLDEREIVSKWYKLIEESEQQKTIECIDMSKNFPPSLIRQILFKAATLGKEKIVTHIINKFYKQPSKDINEIEEMRNEEGATALHAAAYGGHNDLIDCLIEKHKLSISAAITRKNVNILHAAAVFGHIHTIKHLIEKHHMDIHSVADTGETILHAAASGGKNDTIDYLVETCSLDIHSVIKSGVTPLHFAALTGQISTIKHLVEKYNMDINSVDSSNRSVLDWAKLGRDEKKVADTVKFLKDNYFKEPETINQNGKRCAEQLELREPVTVDKAETPKQSEKQSFASKVPQITPVRAFALPKRRKTTSKKKVNEDQIDLTTEEGQMTFIERFLQPDDADCWPKKHNNGALTR